MDTDLGDPRAVTGLVVRIHVDAPYQLPTGPNHLVEPLPYALSSIHIRAAPGAAVDDDERILALMSDADIDADSEAIRAAAARATADARDDRERVTALVRWTHARVAYTYADEPRASAVLAAGAGDCSEITTLFIALTRSLGIPARRVVGLAFTYADGAPSFGYHAWAEVELGGHWQQVDPTWNEPVADATHIKLAEGDSNAWYAAAGRIELWIGDVNRGADVGAIDPARVAAELPAYLRPRL